MTYQLTDNVSHHPVSGASVTMCGNSLVLDCDASASAETTNDAGIATVGIPGTGGAKPSGYLSVSGQGLYPLLAFWGFPLSEPAYSYSNGIFSQTEATNLASGIAQQTGISIDAVAHAVILANVVDCQSNGAPGVTLSLEPPDSGAELLYIRSGEFTQTGPSDTSGQGVFVNVPPGVFTVTATPAGLGRASSVLPVKTVKATETVVTLVPNQ
jgi:hypothetical protein